MKAIVYHHYGSADVLQWKEIEKPIAGDNEVLIRVRAASVNPLGWHFMGGTPYIVRIPAGLRKPKVTRLGVDVAGQVEAVGRNVTQLKPGDEVFGSCRGAFAEYVCTSESALVMKPDNVTFEQAAAVPVAAFTALQGLRDKGHIQPGQKWSTDVYWKAWLLLWTAGSSASPRGEDSSLRSALRKSRHIGEWMPVQNSVKIRRKSQSARDLSQTSEEGFGARHLRAWGQVLRVACIAKDCVGRDPVQQKRRGRQTRHADHDVGLSGESLDTPTRASEQYTRPQPLVAQMNCATDLNCRLTQARIPPGCRTNTSGS